MGPDELACAGAARQAALVRAGTVSPREVLEACLARIERLDPTINAFRAVFHERARAEADHAPRDGPLAGVPVAIKEQTDLDGSFAGRVRAAGAVVIGTTQLPELAAWPFTESAAWGVTRNPRDPARTPGGSSGGSAAAVAAGMCGAAIGTDAGGSIRIPAAACGVVGIKPTRGTVAGHEAWHGLSAAGPIAPGVLDAALLHDALAGTSLAAIAGAPSAPRLRIGWTLHGPSPARVRSDGARRAVVAAATRLRDAGHRVDRRDPDYGPLSAAYVPRYFSGVRESARMFGALEPRTRTLVRLGAACDPLLPSARRLGAACTRSILRLFEDVDALLLPVTAGPPPAAGRWAGRGALRTLAGVAREWPPFTFAFNLTGQPAAAVPVGEDADGLPLAVQLVARPGDEATLVALAAELEATQRARP